MNWNVSAIAATMLILPLGINTVQAQEYNSGDSVIERSYRNKHEGKQGMRDGITKLTQQLDLSSEQSEQIEAIREQAETENQLLFEQLQTNRQEMQSLLTSDANPEQLRANHQDGQNLRQQLSDIRLETMLEIREVLTPEQRTQMAELMAQRRDRRFGDR